jgi:hypothetical protein
MKQAIKVLRMARPQAQGAGCVASKPRTAA